MKTIKIEGMSCNHCVMAVTKALQSIDGLENIQVNLEKGEARYDEKKSVDPAVIAAKIKKAGFDVVGQ
jgi:copper chaperone